MSAKSFGLMVAVALVSSVGIASAGQQVVSPTGIASKGQPVALTDTQLDRVTAGVSFAEAGAAAQGGVVDGSFFLEATNSSPTSGLAEAVITASFTPEGLSPHVLQLSAVALAP